MRRGTKPSKAKVESERPEAPRSRKSKSSSVRDLEKRLAEALQRETEGLKREADAQEQQAATAEILRVISSSPTDIQPVFGAIAASAARLCDAIDGTIFRIDGDQLALVAHEGPIRSRPVGPFSALTPGRPSARAALEARTIHVVDLQAEVDAYPDGSALARRYDFRTVLCVPLIRAGAAIGVIAIRRIEARPFTERQVALLQTFADQAVLAIENVRLFKELEARNKDLTEALEQQTATSEILSVISSSPTDLQPVFDAIAASATRLCDGVYSVVFRYDGELITVAADNGRSAETSAVLRSAYPAPPRRGTLAGRALLERRVIAMTNAQDSRENPDGAERARAMGYRAGLSVPMMRGDVAIGVINVVRLEAIPFTTKQIELLKIFADQAVIAIENVRLFNETKESLERETATGEILRVISSTPTDYQPVFDTIVRSAVNVCGALDAFLVITEGDTWAITAHHGPIEMPVATAHFTRDTVSGRCILERRVIHVEDLATAEDFPDGSDVARRLGFRTILSVPLLRNAEAIGVITIRRAEIQLFTEKQIKLLQTFADQAVIAIENVRLFKELEARNAQLTEALEQQTATSEILKAISRAQLDTSPVFDAIARSAVMLCHAFACRVFRADGEIFHVVGEAYDGPEARALFQGTHAEPIGSDGPSAIAARERQIVQYADVPNDPRVPPRYRERARARGYRALMCVPMMRDDVAIGTITVARREPVLFSEQQVQLIKTFADQAVIAIENVRLVRETKEALERQTATSEILRIIASSPTDVQPVFETIVQNGQRLLAGHSAAVMLRIGDEIHLGAYTSTGETDDAEVRSFWPLSIRTPAVASVFIDGETEQISDVDSDPRLVDVTRTFARHRGWRSRVVVPMHRDGTVRGAIAVTRRDPGPFSDEDIAVLKTFADQAVIAIENVRLFTELQEKNRALTQAHAQVSESLEQQTATSEILRVISQSPTDVQPVFDAIVDNAVRLCDGAWADAYRFDGERQHLVACSNLGPEGRALLQSLYPRAPDPEAATGRAILDRAVIHVPDVHHDPRFAITRHVSGTVGGPSRSLLAVPMLHHGEAVGVILVHRGEQPRPFSSAEIDLLKTFADQAVIAIENVRLFRELEARTQELTRSVGELQALGEVGQAISSTLDLQTVLSTIAARARQLSGTDAGVIYEYDEHTEVFVPRATDHLEAEIVESMLATPVRKGEGATGRLAEVQEPVQVPNILAAPGESRVRGSLVRAGYRALLAVPLVREDHLIGGLTVIRKATGEFGPDIVELLKTFATQSALAIQNARLFREIEQKSRELEAASRHKSEFLANMSHELRTPLNAVIGFSEVLSERMFGELNEKQDEYLKDIHASGQHLLSLINDILDLSKIEAGRMELEVTEFDLPMAIDSALTLVRERAARRSITLHTTVDERLGKVQGDERKIRQVLLNLLSNAIKFTPESGRIEVVAKPVNGSIEISVSDTGVGIAPEHQEAVFEEFKQVGTADKKVEGTGLGLALSRKFIELHGGKIWVKSQVGVGSTFTFTVPVRRGE